jgi:carboxylesterase type B
MISEASKGLFHKAIPMSGVAFNKAWTCIPRRNWAARLAKSLGYDGSLEEKNILKFLESREASEFIDCLFTSTTDEETFGEHILAAYMPCIEPYETENCFIPKDPVLMAREAWGNELPCMLGGTSFEGLLRANFMQENATRVLQNFNYFAPLLELGLNVDSEKAKVYGKRIKEVYYGLMKPSNTNQEPYLHVSCSQNFSVVEMELKVLLAVHFG